MAICASCGTDNTADLKFCGECGAKLSTPVMPREVRKTVTILFADITGSTALGEHLDAESVRAMLGRYFDEIKSIIESHGGTVEKFIGDAVMAVFGIPVLHEDDAVRAVRAAAQIRDRLARLNANGASQGRVAIEVRTGINTGEVVAGTEGSGHTLVTGDAVNTAARLEQAAAPSEILLGASTYRLVRDAVDAEAVEPISAKGKAEPVPAFRLLSVRGPVATTRRRPDARLVGRTAEFDQLKRTFETALAQPQLVTIIGAAGVGKSRLVAEFVAWTAERAKVVKGRCLPYGDGITYWPLREIAHDIAGIGEQDSPDTARGRLAAVVESGEAGTEVARLVATAIGLESVPVGQDELFWAVRRFLEQIASHGPLVALIEDIHWAEPTLLDLIEYIADLTTGVPLLLVCVARPELLESRPGWGANRFNSSVLRLDPLPVEAAGLLLDELPGGEVVRGALRERVLAAAEGNPLFVEEMMAMLRDDGVLVERDGGWIATGQLERVAVPPTIQALLSARVDALPKQEKEIAERAAVVGREFEAAAVRELSTESRDAVGRALLGLVRKELVRPERSERAAGDAFRFRHILIRDAAYSALPKAERAVLHERFAEWLTRVAADRLAEYQEIVGYHLAEAAEYARQLGDMTTASRLAQAAGEHLFEAGRRAAARTDNGAVIPLMRRAIEMTSGDTRVEAQLELASALMGAGNYDEGDVILIGLAADARRRGDEVVPMRVRVNQIAASIGAVDFRPDIIRQELYAFIPKLEAAGLDCELATAWLTIGMLESEKGEAERTAFLRAIDHGRRSGSTRQVSAAIANLADSLRAGPTPVDDALRELDRLAEQGVGQRTSAGIATVRGALIAMRGEFDAARELLNEAMAMCSRIKATTWLVLILGELAFLELMAGRVDAAYRAVLEMDSLMEGNEPMRGVHAAIQSLVLANLGRSEEALAAAEVLDESGEVDPDLISRGWRGRAIAALALRDAVMARTTIDRTIDALELTAQLPALGYALLDRATIRQQTGDADWPADAARAVEVFRRKGHTVGAARAQELLERSGLEP